MADDDAAIQAKIAALAGKINRHKQQQQPEPSAQQSPYPTQVHSHPGQPYRSHHHASNHRWTPFAASRGRGRGGFGPSFQNRTLVNTSAATSTSNTPPPTPPQQNQKQQYVQNRQEKTMLAQHFSRPGVNRELEIEGIRFSMKEDGSKLVRVTGEPQRKDNSREEPDILKVLEMSESYPKTPKKAVVAGVDFFRTKNGNLLRSATINAASKPASKPVVQCEHFIKNGVCPFGAKCRFDHNPDKVSMCKTFFRTGSCPNGDRCDLSHKPTYNRVPACTHYQNGNCTNNACRYAHVSTSPGPLICRSFALLGYCETGTKCDKRHIIECPDYAENGECTNKKCKLPHTRHAHIERQKRTSDDDSELEDEEDEESGGENTDSKDVDSDDLDEDIVMNGDGHEISQNQDFISFS